jgi:hypothetical protein
LFIPSKISQHITYVNAADETKRISQLAVMVQRVAAFCSPLSEIARVLVRFDHVACFIVNANDGIV